MHKRSALITGISGQDGVYLARHLLARDYRVIGVTRQSATTVATRLATLGAPRIDVRSVQAGDDGGLDAVLGECRPDEIYHLAAQSIVHASWERAVETADATAVGAVRLLEAVRRRAPSARVLLASTSEIFGEPPESPQSERSPIAPRSPYGAAKAFAYWTTSIYRRAHSAWAVSAILYNHESPLRSTAFVTRKITDGVARIASGRATVLQLGNLDARRDWGHAADYVDAMWRMLQCDEPCDLVIGTGSSHSVREFCEIAFSEAGLDYRQFVVQDERFFRPTDPVAMVADARLAADRLKWTPTTSFEAMVREMVRADMERVNVSAL